jgi:hypothetical protein
MYEAASTRIVSSAAHFSSPGTVTQSVPNNPRVSKRKPALSLKADNDDLSEHSSGRHGRSLKPVTAKR